MEEGEIGKTRGRVREKTGCVMVGGEGGRMETRKNGRGGSGRRVVIV